MKPEFGIAIRDLPSVHIVALRGELDLATAKGLPETLIAIAGSTVVVDMADLTFMDSSGIAALIVARNQITQDGNDLVLTRPTRIVRKVLEITGLSDWVVDWSAEWS